LYIYRTEIEPWEDVRPGVSVSKDSGISAYGANKLKEAKELLDRGVISEEEFKQIKDDYLK
jgi:shikimate kinase